LQLPSYDSLEELSAKLREAMDNAGDLWGPPWAFFGDGALKKMMPT